MSRSTPSGAPVLSVQARRQGHHHQPGIRAVPSLKYLQAIPQFTEHYYESDDEGDDSVDNGPTGGLTWDGRVDRGRDQARIPLFSPFEMANNDPAEVVAAVSQGKYAVELRKILGDGVFDDPERALAGIVEALEVFQLQVIENSALQQQIWCIARPTRRSGRTGRRGPLFNDPDKGNCGNCHRSQPGKDGTPPQFTDYGLVRSDAAQPRHLTNADAKLFDLSAGLFACWIWRSTATIAAFVTGIAQRRAAAGLLPQWRRAHLAQGDRILRRARYRSRQMVSARCRGRGVEVRRPAGTLSRQRQQQTSILGGKPGDPPAFIGNGN